MIDYLVAIASLAVIYALMALGLNLQWGFTGVINFGVVAFFGVAAYATAITSTSLGLPIGVAILLGAVISSVLAYPVAAITVRLKTDYLALVTLGLAEVVRTLALTEDWLTRGPSGIAGVPVLFPGEEHRLAFLLLGAGIVVLTVVLLQHLTTSPFGRVLRAVRADEIATRSLGKDPGSFRTVSFVVGSLVIGLAGGLYASLFQYVSPDQLKVEITFYVWMALVLGGPGKHLGAIVGSLILIAFLEGTRFVRDLVPFVSATDMAAVRIMVVGLALALLLIYKPEGVLGRVRRIP